MEKKIYYGGEMYHFGILGQRWGQRRYQNPDGTYTEEGKLRRRVDSEPEPTIQEMRKYNEEYKVRKKYNQNKNEEKSQKNYKAKKVLDDSANAIRSINEFNRSRPIRYKPMDLSKMTDQEMRNKINRKRLEEEYIRTFGEREKRTGKEFVEDVINNIGPILSATGSLVLIAKAIYDWRH